jgi:hypothetical protein
VVMPSQQPVEKVQNAVLNASVWFGDLMRNARRSESRNPAKTNGDPGAVRADACGVLSLIAPQQCYAHVFGQPNAAH